MWPGRAKRSMPWVPGPWRILVVAMLVLGSGATAGLVVHEWKGTGVYWGEADVVFITPPDALTPNTLSLVSGSLISTAGIVQREVMGGPPKNRVVSESVTLLDQGVTDGVSVDLPNAGGQWANNFERPVLRVQSVSPEEGVALRRLELMVGRIQQVLDRRQEQAGVSKANWITTQVTPGTISVAMRDGNQKRAAAAALVLGLLVTGSAAVLLDAAGHRRHRRRATPAVVATSTRQVLQPAP